MLAQLRFMPASPARGNGFVSNPSTILPCASAHDLRTALDRLREAGLIFGAGSGDESDFSFNHALVQEAAYESLPRSRRQSLHRQIAVHLESQSTAAGESEPTLIAHH